MPKTEQHLHESVVDIDEDASTLDTETGRGNTPSLGEHLDAYEASRPDEPLELDPAAEQQVYLVVSVVAGLTGAIAVAAGLAGLVWML